jgi:hypothetical protein
MIMFKVLITTVATAGSHDGGGCAVSTVVVEFETSDAARAAHRAVCDPRQVTTNAVQTATLLF